MDTIQFLESLAVNTHHQINLDQLMNGLPDAVKQAVLLNDGEKLKKEISDVEYYADKTGVVQVS